MFRGGSSSTWLGEVHGSQHPKGKVFKFKGANLNIPCPYDINIQKDDMLNASKKRMKMLFDR